MPITRNGPRNDKGQPTLRFRVMLGCPNPYGDGFRPESVDDLPEVFENVETMVECDSLGDAVAKAKRFNESMLMLDKWSSHPIPGWCLVAVSLSEAGVEDGD